MKTQNLALLIASLACLLTAGCGFGSSNTSAGMVMEDFSATTVEGEPIKLSDYRGKVVLVDFWATWCAPCIAELPKVAQSYHMYHEKGFEVIGISLDDDLATLKGFLAKNPQMEWPQICDGKGWNAALAAKYEVRSIPRAILIGRDGAIIEASARGRVLEDALAEAFQE